MIHRFVVTALGLAVVLVLAGTAATQSKAKKKEKAKNELTQTRVLSEEKSTPDAQQEATDGSEDKTNAKIKTKAKTKPKIEKATFGGGCFWCMEAVFERIPGVKSVVSGYAGGHVPNPTYHMVGTGLTGHAEVIQIEYDPSVITFDKLLKFFWSSHDPTTLNSQGPDFGTQYRSIILYHDEDQKKIAQQQYRELMAHRARKSPIVTELVPFTEFYPAEAYHQDYYRNHPYDDYSQIYIVPKLRKLRQKLK
jgi:peptide-methionine (S)-S-oxide reductase